MYSKVQSPAVNYQNSKTSCVIAYHNKKKKKRKKNKSIAWDAFFFTDGRPAPVLTVDTTLALSFFPNRNNSAGTSVQFQIVIAMFTWRKYPPCHLPFLNAGVCHTSKEERTSWLISLLPELFLTETWGAHVRGVRGGQELIGTCLRFSCFPLCL